ncbi:MAG TPA: hypothetical protein VJV74_11935 [Terriglobia bacterium]|nr:hypothetical protein [Terriglobia bacterium]
MGVSVGDQVDHRALESSWTERSHRLTLVCLFTSLLLALVLLAPLNPFGYQVPRWGFQAATVLGLAALALSVFTRAKGLDVRLPGFKSPFAWFSSLLVFLTIMLRYVLLAEAGALAFLAFPSPQRYLALLLTALGIVGIVTGVVRGLAERRAERLRNADF